MTDAAAAHVGHDNDMEVSDSFTTEFQPTHLDDDKDVEFSGFTTQFQAAHVDNHNDVELSDFTTQFQAVHLDDGQVEAAQETNGHELPAIAAGTQAVATSDTTANPTATNSRTTFHVFPLLPFELQYDIWEIAAASPSIIEELADLDEWIIACENMVPRLEAVGARGDETQALPEFTVNTCWSSLMHVCFLSRRAALRSKAASFRFSPTAGFKVPFRRFDPAIDTLIASLKIQFAIPSLARHPGSKAMLRGVRSIAYVCSDVREHHFDYGQVVRVIDTSLFPSVTTVTYILGDRDGFCFPGFFKDRRRMTADSLRFRLGEIDTPLAMPKDETLLTREGDFLLQRNLRFLTKYSCRDGRPEGEWVPIWQEGQWVPIWQE